MRQRKLRELLATPDLLERCLDKETWADIGVTLVELEPDGDILPTRARYDPQSLDPSIGLNPLTYEGRLWYALPDVAAAAVLRPGSPPRVTRAIRLRPVGMQAGLRSVRLRGQEQIDPSADRDPFLSMVEQRQRVRSDLTLSGEERDRLERFLKITANATSYGTLARFDRRDQAEPVPVMVYGPDPDMREESTTNPEDPGPFCFPPVAASITAAARLILALLERLVTDAGGTYAFCDTDSMAIVASPDGEEVTCPAPGSRDTVEALSFAQVRAILDRFDRLNPYDRSLIASPWKVEADSLDEPLWCYAISAKRYCLFRTTSGGEPVVVGAVDGSEECGDESPDFDEGLEDWSEHGLGLYLDPAAENPDRPRRDRQGRRVWVRTAWEWLMADALDRERPFPVWSERYALTRFTVSGPRIRKWFAGYDAEQPSEQRIRPGSFGLIAHPHRAFDKLNRGAQPAAPYETDPERWPVLPWYNRRDGRPLRVVAADKRRDPETFAAKLSGGAVVVQTLGGVLGRYRHRAERKSRAPDGSPAGRETAGLLDRRWIASTPSTTVLTGKEGGKLAERLSGEVTDPAEYRTEYGRRADVWRELVLPVLAELGARKLIDATGFSSSAVYRVLEGTVPSSERQTRYQKIAVDYVRGRLAKWQTAVPRLGLRPPCPSIEQSAGTAAKRSGGACGVASHWRRERGPMLASIGKLVERQRKGPDVRRPISDDWLIALYLFPAQVDDAEVVAAEWFRSDFRVTL